MTSSSEGIDPLSGLVSCLQSGDWACVEGLFTDGLHYRAFRLLWEEGLDPPRRAGEYLVFSTARGVVVGVNDDGKLFVNVVGRLHKLDEGEVRRAMGFQRHCGPRVCAVTETGAYRIQGDLVARIALYNSAGELARDLSHYLDRAWHAVVMRFAEVGLARWLAWRGYNVERGRYHSLVLPGVYLTPYTLDKARALLRRAAAHLAGLLREAGAACGGVRLITDGADSADRIKASAGCVEIEASNGRRGLHLSVRADAGRRGLAASITETLRSADVVKLAVGNHLVVGRFAARWRLVLRAGRRALAAAVRGPLVALDSFEVRHRQHGRTAVLLGAPYALVELYTARSSPEQAAVFNAARLSME
ncbi:MAG: hypothetical protein ACP5MH_08065 [Thermoproteus sp.]